MKIINVLFIIIVSLFLFGCDETTTSSKATSHTTITSFTTNKEDTFDIILNNELGLPFESFNELEDGDILDLPDYFLENYVFVGWTDGELNYCKEITVTENLVLSPVLELAEEVFSTIYVEDLDGLLITDYIGVADYLKIPEIINGDFVRGIATNAFFENMIIEVMIPNTVKEINIYAFKNMPLLEKVSFYGEIHFDFEKVISQTEFNEIINDYSSLCVVETRDGDLSWTYSNGCPIKEVLSSTEPVIIQGVEYRNYHVVMDYNFYSGNDVLLNISGYAFDNLLSLESITFSKYYNAFNPLIFNETPSLEIVEFIEDNPFYEVSEGIVYSNALSELLYLPPAIEIETLSIPNNVYVIKMFAFYANKSIVSINLNKELTNVDPSAFLFTTSLEEILVDEENFVFESRDGVLYMLQSEETILIHYPSAKTGNTYVVDNVSVIAHYAFAGNKYLETVILPEGLETIGPSAFYASQSIRVIDLPTSVEMIGSNAIRDSGVEVLIVRRSIVEQGYITVSLSSSFPEGLVVYVPDDSYNDYLESNYWYQFYNIIKPISEYSS